MSMTGKILISLVCFLSFYGFIIVLTLALCRAAALGDRQLERERAYFREHSPVSLHHAYLTGDE